jgi:hypothetical protein
MEDQATGGLQLPPTVGPGFEIESQIEASWNTFEDMELALSQMGFPPVEKPNFNIPQLTPEVLTSPDSKKYTEIYWQIEAWHTYAFNTMARIKAILVQIVNEQNKIERVIRKEEAQPNADGSSKPKQTKTQLDDLIANTPRYEELTYEKQKLDQQKQLMQSYVDSLDRDLKLVSRQVEIRRQDIDHGRRATNLPGHGNYGQSR